MKDKKAKKLLAKLAIKELHNLKPLLTNIEIARLARAKTLNVFKPKRCIYGILYSKPAHAKSVEKLKKQVSKKFYSSITNLDKVSKEHKDNFSPLEVIICWLKPKDIRQIVKFLLNDKKEIEFDSKKFDYIYEPGNSSVNINIK